MLHLAHVHIIKGGGGIVADAGLETFRGGEIHVLRISHRCAVHEKIVGKGLIDMLVDLCTPHTVAVALHGDGFAKDFASQLHLLGIRGLHTEDHAVVLIFR